MRNFLTFLVLISGIVIGIELIRETEIRGMISHNPAAGYFVLVSAIAVARLLNISDFVGYILLSVPGLVLLYTIFSSEQYITGLTADGYGLFKIIAPFGLIVYIVFIGLCYRMERRRIKRGQTQKIKIESPIEM